MKNKIFLIKWIDSMRELMGWQFISEFDLDAVKKEWVHNTIGLVVKEDKEAITLANSWRNSDCKDDDLSVMGLITIPKIVIKSKKEIK